MYAHKTYETYPIVFVLGAFVCGILLDQLRKGKLPLGGIAITLILSAFLLTLIYLYRRRIRQNLLIFLFVLAGYAHSGFHDFRLKDVSRRNLNQVGKYQIDATIMAKKTRIDGTIECTGKDLIINNRREKGKLLIRLKTDTIPMASRATFACQKVYAIKSLENRYEFNYAHFLARNQVWGRIYPEEFVIQNQKKHSARFLMWQHKAKSIICKEVKNQTAASVISAMVLGEKGDLDRETRNSISKLGMAHVMAVSGLHMGIVFLLLSIVINWFKRIAKINYPRLILLSIPFMFIYVAVTGSSPSATRAFGMLSIFLLSRFLIKNKTIGFEVIGTVAFIILAINPNQLFSISFLLSFVAIVGIILHFGDFSPLIQKNGNSVYRYVVGGTLIGLICTVYCTPLLFYFFHSSSWLGPFTSVFATTVAFLIILLAGVTLIMELFSLGGIFSFINGSIAESFLRGNEMLGRLPTSVDQVWLGELSLIFLMISGFLFLKILSGRLSFVMPLMISLLLFIQTNHLERQITNYPKHIEIYNTYTDWQIGIFGGQNPIAYSSTGELITKNKLYKASSSNQITVRKLPRRLVIDDKSYCFLSNGQKLDTNVDYVFIDVLKDKAELEKLKKYAGQVICKRNETKDKSNSGKIYEMQELGPLQIDLISGEQKWLHQDENPY